MLPYLRAHIVLALTIGTHLAVLNGHPWKLIWAELQFDGVIFDTLGLAEFSVPSLSRCLLSCSQDARCVSVFYQESRGQCRLQGGRFYLAQGGREDQGWRYYLMETATDPRCPVRSGYIHRRDLSLCYRLEFQVGATHSEAVSNCTKEGGHLLRIDSQEKQDQVALQLDSSNATAVDFYRWTMGFPGYYIDGEYTNGTWTWPSIGQPMTYSHWNGAQSELDKPTQNCTALTSTRQWLWSSVQGNYPRPYICEIRI